MKQILEAIYEPQFMDSSHGSRENRSCHTALSQLKQKFKGANWFIEGDIKGFFDNMNQSILFGLLKKEIKDGTGVLRSMDMIGEFDEELFGMMVEQIKVINLVKVEFVLQSGVGVIEVVG